MKYKKFIRTGFLAIFPILIGINAHAGFLSSYALGTPTSLSISSVVGASASTNNTNEVISNEENEKIEYQNFEQLIYPSNFSKMSNETLTEIFDDGRGIYENFYNNDKFVFNLKPEESIKIALKWSKVTDKNSKITKISPDIKINNDDKFIEVTQDENNIYIKNKNKEITNIFFVNSIIKKASNENEYNLIIGNTKKSLIETQKTKKNMEKFNNIMLSFAMLCGIGLGIKLIREFKKPKSKPII